MIRMNQHPPVHQFKMRPFKPKTHPLPLPRDFSAPFFAPKFSPPTYSPPLVLPTSPILPPSPHFLLIPSPKLGKAPELE